MLKQTIISIDLRAAGLESAQAGFSSSPSFLTMQRLRRAGQ